MTIATRIASGTPRDSRRAQPAAVVPLSVAPVAIAILAASTIPSRMRYKTVNLQPATYERLRRYQFSGRSLSDVIDQLMDVAEPEELYLEALKVHRRRMKELKRSGGLSISDTRQALAKRD